MSEESPKAFVERVLQGMRDFTIDSAELRTRGPEVVPHLYAALDDKNSFQIVHALILLKANDKKSIGELRKRAEHHEFPNAWFSAGLAALGDIKWLEKKDPKMACVGLAMLFGGILWRSEQAPPLDYSALESLLERHPSLKSLAERELEPGSGYVTPTPADIDALEQGARSRFAVIRWHATSLLGEKCVRQRKRAFVALENRLSDRHSTVRRLALLSLSWLGGKIPEATLDKARRLQDDKQSAVSDTAQRLFGG